MTTAQSPKLAYISAASHSGSTLLAMLLNAHPRICTAGELKIGSLGDADFYRCSCRTMIRDCTFWQSVTQEMAQRGETFEVGNARTDLASFSTPYTRRLLRPLHRGAGPERLRDTLLSLSPAWRRGIDGWRVRNRALIESIAAVSGQQVIVDSSKTGLRMKYLKSIEGLDFRLIRLVRDGRAVALTYVDAANYADACDPTLRGGGTGKRKSVDLTMQQSALEWRRSNEEAGHLAQSLGSERVLQVRYEDLCTDTAATLNRVTQFLGLEEPTDFSAFKQTEHHVVGNGMRLDDTSEIKLDDRWRSVLTATDLAAFDSIAGQLNAHYGYGN